ncbi:MAG: amino acid ABC transporter permease [Oscillospiraceae bacterium]|nr:amino acid ABC transporter permease [Oscillospiraceae bacterium]
MADFFGELYNQIYVTFIYEDRWRFFVDGFWMTLLLTFSSFILGTLIGILFCKLKLSGIRWVRGVTKVFTSLLIQIPTLVLLMLFVYFIFGSIAFPIILSVIIGLTLKTGCYMADIFQTAVETVAPGEVEAARTLGMTRFQSFRYVILPQTVKTALPVYQNQFISCLQETSVVGYLAIMDLTRASDIVSARTFDAMFALLAVTLIYLIIGWGVGALLKLLERKKHLGGESQ